jgi:hypothetical protein
MAAVPRITNALEVQVGVYSEDESLQTTTAARVPCDKSILCGASAPTEDNEAHYASEAQAAADRAEACRNDQKDGDQIHQHRTEKALVAAVKGGAAHVLACLGGGGRAGGRGGLGAVGQAGGLVLPVAVAMGGIV